MIHFTRSMVLAAFVGLSMLLPACSGDAAGEDEETGEQSDELATQGRIVHARVYQQGHWTVPGRDAADVGKQLASLRPSYVSGLVRLETPSANAADYEPQRVAFDTIRTTVRASSPKAKFDIVLNILPKQYPTAEAMWTALELLQFVFQPDGWFFDFLDNGDEKVVRAAVAFARSHKQFIGGNLNGGNGKVPKGIDFVSITDGTAVAKHVDNLRRTFKGPVFLHIENNPQNSDEKNAAAVFLAGGSAHRKEHIRELARAQNKDRYTLMFPVFYPLYPQQESPYRSYDAVKDGTLPAIKAAMGSKG